MTGWALLVLVPTAGLLALAALFVLAALQRHGDARAGGIFADRCGGTVFLFDGDRLVDATPPARALLAQGAAQGPSWARLLAYLGPRFPQIEPRLAGLEADGMLTLASRGSDGMPLSLQAEHRGGLLRITLSQDVGHQNGLGHDLLTLRALQDELAQLRGTLAQAPLLIWRETASGEVVWANARYLTEVCDRLDPGQDLSWPLPRLLEAPADNPVAHGQRQRLMTEGRKDRWFDLSATTDDQGERLIFAIPADTTVQAEGALREFTQTLTKTFAHLPIGLAIFDRQRQLQLFNPALLDLCNLPPDFLSARPTLFAFLDMMRDRNMLPEPKDYRSWRKQMAELEAAAASGHYEETWSLPSGQTYRLIGRPHPNGALALMFEDISNEITRIRRYRADLELGQAVLDSMDEALAVFSAAGVMVMANSRYGEIWGHDPAGSIAGGTLATVCSYWRDRSAPSAFWTEAEAFCRDDSREDALRGDIRLQDGRLVHCAFSRLPGGAALARFSVAGPALPEPVAPPAEDDRRSA